MFAFWALRRETQSRNYLELLLFKFRCTRNFETVKKCFQLYFAFSSTFRIKTQV